MREHAAEPGAQGTASHAPRTEDGGGTGRAAAPTLATGTAASTRSSCNGWRGTVPSPRWWTRSARETLQRVAVKETPPDETLYNQPGAGGKAGATNYYLNKGTYSDDDSVIAAHEIRPSARHRRRVQPEQPDAQQPCSTRRLPAARPSAMAELDKKTVERMVLSSLQQPLVDLLPRRRPRRCAGPAGGRRRPGTDRVPARPGIGDRARRAGRPRDRVARHGSARNRLRVTRAQGSRRGRSIRPRSLPGAYGTIALSGATIAGPVEAAVEVRGWLRDLLPERAYERFRVRTAAVAVPG